MSDTKLAAREWSPKVLFIDYGIGFGGSVISMCQLVNNFPETLSAGVTVLSTQNEEIVRPLLHRGRYLRFRMPVNYVLKQKLGSTLSEHRVPLVLRKMIFRLYTALDWVSDLVCSIYIYTVIKGNKADIVHINNGFNLSGIRAARWAAIPCIVHCRAVPKVEKGISVKQKFKDSVSTVIAISSAVEDSLLKCGISGDKIRVVHNPVDCGIYEAARSERDSVRERWHIHPDDVVVSIFGRVIDWKGQLEFIRAVSRITDHCPNIKVMVVGDWSDSSKAYFDKAVELSETKELSGKVIFVGYQERVFEYYWASDIVVNNSQLPEPFGRVVVEAMACECAVVAMNEGGPPDIISNGVDGILVAPRNESELAGAIRKLYDSRELRDTLGSNGKRTVEERFEAERIAGKVMEIYSIHLSR